MENSQKQEKKPRPSQKNFIISKFYFFYLIPQYTQMHSQIFLIHTFLSSVNKTSSNQKKKITLSYSLEQKTQEIRQEFN